MSPDPTNETPGTTDRERILLAIAAMIRMPDPVVRAESGPHKGCPVLKPCPFCGSAEALRFEFSGSQGYIVCDSCDAMGPCDAKAADPICDVDAAYNAWNRRATANA